MAKSKRRITRGRKKRGDTIKLVVKSNELVEARYMFDVWETRFFLTLIASITKDDADDKVYRIWFKDIKTNFQLKSNQSYHYLREAAISMAGKSVYIGWMNDEFRRGRMHRIIRFVDFLEDGQTGGRIGQQEYVDVSIDKDIKPYLLDIKKKFDPSTTRYTSYDLRNVIKLKPYGTRIYELLKQFEFKGFRTIKVEDLKDMFEITDEYPRFSNFYQKVIKYSIIAINKHTDLNVPLEHIEKIKKGRRVHALRFKIESKSKQEVAILRGDNLEQGVLFPAEEQAATSDEIVMTESDMLFAEFEEVVVRSFGVTPSVFLKMLNSGKFTKAQIEQAISVTRRAKYKQEISKSVPGFFVKSLKEGFTDPQEEQKKKRRDTVAQEKKRLKSELLALQEALSQKINDRIRDVTTQNHEVTQQAIDELRGNPVIATLIQAKEQAKGTALELEDYRKDEQLRAMVISNIVQQQKSQFEDIFEFYNPKIRKVEGELKGISIQ